MLEFSIPTFFFFTIHSNDERFPLSHNFHVLVARERSLNIRPS